MTRYSKVVKKRKKKKSGFLPESVHIFAARKLVDSVGLFFFLAGLAIILSITSYSHSDPSWNTASDVSGESVQNILGISGAYIADFMLQTIGLGSALIGIVFAIWGIRIYKRQTIGPLWLRIGALITAGVMAATALTALPSGDWLIQEHLGGSGGILVYDKFSALLFGIENPKNTITLFAGMVTLIALSYAVAISRAEWKMFFTVIWHAVIAAALFVVAIYHDIYNWVMQYGMAPPETGKKRESEVLARLKTMIENRAEKIRQKREKKAEKPRRKAPQVAAAKAAPSSPAAASTPVPHDPVAAPEKTAASIQVVTPKKAAAEPVRQQTSFALNEDGEWELPGIDLLQTPPVEESTHEHDEAALQKNAEMLQNVLNDFKIQGEIVSIHPGPVVTLYELEPAPGIKTSRIIGLSDDIARSMSAISVRCAVIPGRNVIGIELPNAKRQTVHFQHMLGTEEVQKTKAKLPLILGKNIGGQPIIADLAKMPHLLVAGTTGSGKSVAVNTMILSLLYRLPPEKCRFIMIDPKMLELSVYDDIPHLLSPVVTEAGKAVMSLKWLVHEMEERYRAMSKLNVRNIEGYNARLKQAQSKGETLMRKVQTGFDTDTGKPVYEDQPMDMTELPYIVVVIDEFADLMVVAGKDVESAVQRLAQMARAAGIHLIMATQRPSVDVITGVIKANFPTRISFQVTSKTDSRTILNEGGAEQLLGMGDMLYLSPGDQAVRIHGPFVPDDDVEHVVSFLKSQGEPAYLSDVTEGSDSMNESEVMNAMFGGNTGGDKVDDLYDEAVALVARERKASTSFIQRCLQIGYNRAARIIEEMEKQGVVSPATATGKREVLVGDYSDA